MKSMETKNRIEQIKGDIPKMHASQASKFVKQFENVVDRATNIPKVKEIRFVGV